MIILKKKRERKRKNSPIKRFIVLIKKIGITNICGVYKSANIRISSEINLRINWNIRD